MVINRIQLVVRQLYNGYTSVICTNRDISHTINYNASIAIIHAIDECLRLSLISDTKESIIQVVALDKKVIVQVEMGSDYEKER